MGQYIDTVAGEQAGYAWTLAQAKRDGNATAIRELEALQPYPGDTTIAKIDAERKWANHYGGLFRGHSDGDFYFRLARLSPDYTPEQRSRYDAGSQFSTELLEQQLKGLSFVPVVKLDCPVYMLLGRHDGLTPAPLASHWLARLRAPTKKAFWFENSAHMAMIEEPGRTLVALLDIRRMSYKR
jgi:pimeloyl-ACP methyl ester carboxylesterase